MGHKTEEQQGSNPAALLRLMRKRETKENLPREACSRVGFGVYLMSNLTRHIVPSSPDTWNPQRSGCHRGVSIRASGFVPAPCPRGLAHRHRVLGNTAHMNTYDLGAVFIQHVKPVLAAGGGGESMPRETPQSHSWASPAGITHLPVLLDDFLHRNGSRAH
jgi:hypothetical protein